MTGPFNGAAMSPTTGGRPAMRVACDCITNAAVCCACVRASCLDSGGSHLVSVSLATQPGVAFTRLPVGLCE